MDLPITEQRNPESELLDMLGTEEVVSLVVRDAIAGARAVEEHNAAIGAVVDVAVRCLKEGGRILYVGAGTSGRLGVLDASECPPTFGTDPEQVVGIIAGGNEALVRSLEGIEDDRDAGREAVRKAGVSAKDLVIGIAASGRTPYVLAALEEARAMSAATAGIAFVEEPELAVACDLLVSFSVGPEILSGSTRLKAGTATKIVLNAITTSAMVRAGRAYSNLMVDLSPRCEKLRQRARRIVRELTALGADEVGSLLEESGWDVKAAIVMGRCGVSPDEARARLEAADGFLRRVIGP